MENLDLAGLVWRKSSFSGLNGCVQMASLPDGSVVLRDSKRPNLGILLCASSAWAALLEAGRSGELDVLSGR
ncbi:DUF397 domain-containing protein [Kineosporia sp. NBRC 101731]|uniref:DUF397 domain-containing protein n=1 Tax=Kineosporia sp. NBRC 101731 TaxID=3032199 RepID=UPI0033338BC4